MSIGQILFYLIYTLVAACAVMIGVVIYFKHGVVIAVLAVIVFLLALMVAFLLHVSENEKDLDDPR